MQALRSHHGTRHKAILQPSMLITMSCLILANSACLVRSLANMSASFFACRPQRSPSIHQVLHIRDPPAHKSEIAAAILSIAETLWVKHYSYFPGISRILHRGVQIAKEPQWLKVKADSRLNACCVVMSIKSQAGELCVAVPA